jgi:hypothetical protein
MNVAAQIDAKQLNVHVDLQEDAGGPLTHLAQMPDLGALALHLTLVGPRDAVQTLLDLHAGLARRIRQRYCESGQQCGRSGGGPGLTGDGADLRRLLATPVIARTVAWHAGRTGDDGPTGGDADRGARCAGQNLDRRTLRGESDTLVLDANVGSFRLDSPSLVIPDSNPLIVHAQAKLGDRARPIDFTLNNALLNIRGRWNLATVDGSASASIADIKPFVAMGGLDLIGRGTLDVKFAITKHVPRLDASTDLDIRGGAAPIAQLLQPHAHAECSLLFRDKGIEFDNTHVEASNVRASLNGSILGGILNLGWKASIADIVGAVCAAGR